MRVMPKLMIPEQLRRHYRPEPVRVLFVEESAPAGGTFFYSANSRLFSATREAFSRVGDDARDDAAFLARFQAAGCWVWDICSRPVNGLPAPQRRGLLEASAPRLDRLLLSISPRFVVSVKKGDVAQIVATAAYRARMPADRILALPFPVMQWREPYIRDLARFLSTVGL